MTFQEFLTGQVFQSLTLLHAEEEVEEYTLCDFGLESFTVEGAIHWADVLQSKLVDSKEFDGIVYVWVEDVAAERVEDFQASHAGYCSERDWNAWFQMTE